MHNDCRDLWPLDVHHEPESILNIAKCTVHYAPMHAISFCLTWMRALQIDPTHGRLQRQAQVCLYGCIVSVCVQTSLIIPMPLCMECECKESDVYTGALSRMQASTQGPSAHRAEGEP